MVFFVLPSTESTAGQSISNTLRDKVAIHIIGSPRHPCGAKVRATEHDGHRVPCKANRHVPLIVPKKSNTPTLSHANLTSPHPSADKIPYKHP